ncbi:Potassium efflux system KefA protein [Alkalibacterium sp. AK22]|uniref:mechanosensitive ion channel family protein n=1 Tax=Alkalibacterium sp. AK22 TaxID=1229520 RepID=UPI0004522C58|nr:mechanosensitive ion channel domain-containing protein [Alkalibacterium sp. AK22]EXJ24462.1 Potassium efflux system KefA protein [Alkalibacterium sp. AK22]
MQNIAEWNGRLDNYGIGFWVGAVLGFVLILAGRYALKKGLDKVIKTERTRLFLKTLLNWLTFFVLIVYLFSYFSRTALIYQTLFVFGDTEITIFLVLTVLFSLILAVKLSNAIREYILPTVYEKYGLDRGMQASMNTFFHYLIVTIAVLVAISSIGFDLTSLAVFASVLGVGIGFGLQNVMSNFISGIILLFERPIKVGDRVIVDNTIADVEEIGMRATVVRTRLHERMIIPNSYFLEEKFVNRSYADTRLRLAVSIGVAYDSDVALVKQLLHESVVELREEKWNNILLEPEPRVFFEDFGDSSLDFTVWFWIDMQSEEREFRIPSDMRFKIFEKCNQKGIEIPFPQRDVNIKGSVS